MDSVVHFEIPTDDDERAKTFYSEVFGWRIDDIPGMDPTDYRMAYTTESSAQGMPAKPGAINGGFFHRTDELPRQPVVTIGIDDLDEALEKVRSHGGAVEGETFEVEGMGRGAYVKDSEGNLVGLWQDTMDRQPG